MRMIALLAAFALPPLLTAAPVPEEKVKDEEAIVGVWKAETVEDGSGRVPPAEKVAEMRLMLKKDGKMVSRLAPDREAEGTYKLDPTASPKEIDLTEGKITSPAVYELDGDTLKLCVGLGNTRPTEIKADAKRFVAVITLKRVKEGKKVKDEEAILGAWSVTKFDNGTGTFPTDATLARMRCTFTKDGKRVTVGGDGEERGDEFKLDPTAKPKAIDITVKGVTYLGVYELDGDTLTVCTGQDAKTRPTERKAEKDKFSLTVFKRLTEEKKDK